jgi:hypothetical protein
MADNDLGNYPPTTSEDGEEFLPCSFKRGAVADAFYLRKDSLHEFLYKRYSGWQRVKYSLVRMQDRLLEIVYILRASFRSFRGHSRIQLATGMIAVTGVTTHSEPLDSPTNAHTLSRSQCTRDLLAKHPWVDSVDIRMFLMGYRAAEKATLGIQDTELVARN